MGIKGVMEDGVKGEVGKESVRGWGKEVKRCGEDEDGEAGRWVRRVRLGKMDKEGERVGEDGVRWGKMR